MPLQVPLSGVEMTTKQATLCLLPAGESVIFEMGMNIF